MLLNLKWNKTDVGDTYGWKINWNALEVQVFLQWPGASSWLLEGPADPDYSSVGIWSPSPQSDAPLLMYSAGTRGKSCVNTFERGRSHLQVAECCRVVFTLSCLHQLSSRLSFAHPRRLIITWTWQECSHTLRDWVEETEGENKGRCCSNVRSFRVGFRSKTVGILIWRCADFPKRKKKEAWFKKNIYVYFTLHLKRHGAILASLPLPQTDSPSSTVFNNVAGAFYAVGWVTLACRRDGCCANRCLHQPWVNTEPCLGIILPKGDLLPPPLVSFPTHHVKYSGVAASPLCPPVSCSLIITNNVPPP